MSKKPKNNIRDFVLLTIIGLLAILPIVVGFISPYPYNSILYLTIWETNSDILTLLYFIFTTLFLILRSGINSKCRICGTWWAGKRIKLKEYNKCAKCDSSFKNTKFIREIEERNNLRDLIMMSFFAFVTGLPIITHFVINTYSSVAISILACIVTFLFIEAIFLIKKFIKIW